MLSRLRASLSAIRASAHAPCSWVNASVYYCTQCGHGHLQKTWWKETHLHNNKHSFFTPANIIIVLVALVFNHSPPRSVVIYSGQMTRGDSDGLIPKLRVISYTTHAGRLSLEQVLLTNYIVIKTLPLLSFPIKIP